MLPFEIPANTTLESLFAEVLPKAHAQMVPPTAGTDRFIAVHKVAGWKVFTFEIRGQALRVSEGAADAPDFWIHVEKASIELFLNDWTGDKRLFPKRVPKDLVSVSDPRVLKRLALVSGTAELAVTDLDTRRIAMTAACGAAAKRPIDVNRPDVVLETNAKTLVRLLDGSLPPEDAMSDGAVSVRGKRMIAMQLAFAFAPFYPKRA
jgi:putative sterol carrier protein